MKDVIVPSLKGSFVRVKTSFVASYYRRFISGFACIAHPLHRLTRKDVPYETALEGVLSDSTYSLLPGMWISVLETDASGLGLGAVLSQEKEGQLHPIANASRTLDTHARVQLWYVRVRNTWLFLGCTTLPTLYIIISLDIILLCTRTIQHVRRY